MAAYQYIYVMKGLSKTFTGGREILKNIHLSFLPGAKIGVLGSNGAGKSTLLNIMAGVDTQFTGEAWAADNVKVGYLTQEPQLESGKTVYETVMEGMGETKKILDRFNEVSAKFAEEMTDEEMNDLLAEQSELQEKIDNANAWDLDRHIEIAMDALRLPPSDADVGPLSGGEKRRVALCRLLLSSPDMLLLDEPTNHLDAESVSWLQRFLHDFAGTVVTVTHDRYFLDEVAGWILELDRGQGIPYEGNYSGWLEQKQKRMEQEGRQDASRMRSLAEELEWVRASPRGRQVKSKARLTAYEELLAQGQEKAIDNTKIMIPAGPRLGDLVIETNNLVKGFSDQLLIDELSFRLPAGGIVGIIGPNGAGKTTILKTISGAIDPRKGKVFLSGSEIQKKDPDKILRLGMSHAPEGREVFPYCSVLENLEMGAYTRSDRKGIQKDIEQVYDYFPILKERKNQPAGLLSGGEQQMLCISRALMSKPEIMLLDEPSLGLSPKLVKEIFEIIIRINKELKTTILLVEQNANIALSNSDFGYVLELGRIVMEGNSKELLEKEDIKEFYLGQQDEGIRGERRWKKKKMWR